MKLRISAAAVLLALLACAPAWAKSVTLNVRIEGAKRTLFQGKVTTSAETITKDSSGPHACNGENGGANSTPGPTVTTALDSTARKAGINWTATWSQSFGDFFIDSIGSDAGTQSSYWLAALNYKDLTVGGCQQEVRPGDQVLWYFTNGNVKHLLELNGPRSARAGKPFKIRVIDGKTGKGVAGAVVGGRKTGPRGFVVLRFARKGRHELKATQRGSIRSNELTVQVRAH